MAQDYTILSAKNAGEKDNPHGGTLVKWYLRVEGFDKDVYSQRKPGNDFAPGTYYGRIEEGEFGPRLYLEQRPDGSGSQGSSGGTFSASRYQKEGMTKDDYWGNKDKRDVESQARMGRAHAQEMALRWAAVVWPQPQEIEDSEIDALTKLLRPVIDWFHDDVQRFPLDADVGGGAWGSASQEEPRPKAPATADVSAGNQALMGHPHLGGSGGTRDAEYPIEEASPAQKGKLTQLFGKAGLSRDAMKAVVLYRCRSEKATKDGASKLIQDLMDGATHDTLLAEIHDAKRAGDPLAIRAAKLIPPDVPLAEDPEEKAQEYEDESGVPF